MAKRGLRPDEYENLLERKSRGEGWVLCVGAGTSLGAFPGWYELAEKLACLDCSSSEEAASLIRQLSKSLGLDALIQTAQNRLKIPPEDFPSRLSEQLYSKIKGELADEWPGIAKALSALSPADLKPPQWKAFLHSIENHYPRLSALPIARVLAEIAGTDKAPASIVSFNAETLLYALATGYIGQNGRETEKGIFDQPRAFDRVTRSLSGRQRHRIPYFHCHGILPIPDGSSRFNRASNTDKLVFSETDYLQLANNSYSWQSSVFLSSCSLRSMVFIGLSLTDSNMRRWLSWVQSIKLRELALIGKSEVDSTSHYWINQSSGGKKEREWIEASVAHLGVRLIWIDQWTDLEGCLRLLTGTRK